MSRERGTHEMGSSKNCHSEAAGRRICFLLAEKQIPRFAPKEVLLGDTRNDRIGIVGGAIMGMRPPAIAAGRRQHLGSNRDFATEAAV